MNQFLSFLILLAILSLTAVPGQSKVCPPAKTGLGTSSGKANTRQCSATVTTLPKSYFKNGFDLMMLQGVNNDGEPGGAVNSGSNTQARQYSPGYSDMEVSTGPEGDRVPVVAKVEGPPCVAPADIDIYNGDTLKLCPSGQQLLFTSTYQANTTTWEFAWYKGKYPGGTLVAGPASGVDHLDLTATYAEGNAMYYAVVWDKANPTSTSCVKIDSIYVKAVAVPEAKFIVNHLACVKGGIILTAKDSETETGATYRWIEGISSPFSHSSLINATSVKTVGPLRGGFYSLIIDKEGCISSSGTSLIYENPLPEVSITTGGDDLKYCENKNGVTLKASSTIEGKYQWYKDTSKTGAETTVNSLTTSLGNATKGTYKVVVTTAEGCRDTSESVITEVDSLPKGGELPLKDSVCIGVTGITYLLIGDRHSTAYSWTVPQGAIIMTGRPGSITVDFRTATSGEITVTPVNACGNGEIKTMPVKFMDKPKGGKIVIKDTVCEGVMENAAFVDYIADPDVSSVAWQIPSDAASTGAGGVFKSIGISFVQGGSPITATPKNICGAGDSVTTSVVVLKKVADAGLIYGADTICDNQEETYSIDPVMFATDYTWTVTPALSAADIKINGKEIKIKFGTAVKYTLQVTPRNKCYEGQSSTLEIINDGQPLPEIILTQLPSPGCSDAPVKIAASLKSGGIAPVRKWTIGNLASGVKIDTLSINNPVDGTQVNLTMTSSQSCASPKTVSKSLNLVVQPAPSKAHITASNFTICAKDTLLTAENPLIGTGKWSIRSGDPATVDANGKVHLIANRVTEKTARIYYTVSTTGNACKPTADSVDIKIKPVINNPDAGQDKTICLSDGTLQLAGTGEKAGETGTWTAAGSASVTAAGIATFTQAGEFEFIYTVRNGFCKNEDTVVVNVDQLPGNVDIVTANDTVCNTVYNVQAAVPAVGTGVFKPAGSFDVVNATNVKFKLPLTGENKLIWEVKNGVCPIVKDSVIITKVAQPLASEVSIDSTGGTFIKVKNKTLNLCLNHHYRIEGQELNAAQNEKGNWFIKGNLAAVTDLEKVRTQDLSLLQTGTSTKLGWVISKKYAGCVSDTATVTLNVNSSPADPGIITGEDTVCTSVQNQEYQTAAVTGATTYEWTTTGGTITAGKGTSAVKLNLPDVTVQTKITLSVKAKNSCGESVNASVFDIEVLPNLKPEVTIEADSNRICADSSATFTIKSVSSETTKPVYTWMLKSGNSETAKGSQDKLTLNGLRDGDRVYVKMKSDYPCTLPVAVNSAEEIMQILPMKPVTVSLEAFPGGPVCAGTTVVFKARPVNPGSVPVYKWTIGGSVRTDDVDDSVQVVFSKSTDILVELISDEICYDNKASKTLPYSVIPNTPMEIEALAATEICAGKQAQTFTATAKAGTALGTSPVYSWTLKDGLGITTKGTLNTFTPAADLPSGDYTIILVVKTTAPCAEKSTDTVRTTHTVFELPEAAIQGDRYYCPGQNVKLTAEETGLTYKWTGGNAEGLTTDFVNVTAGTYNVEVKNPVTGCSSISAEHAVDEFTPANYIVAEPGDATVCAEDSVKLKVRLTGSSYVWTKDGDPLSGNDSTINAKEAGQYKAVVTLIQGNASCTSEANRIVSIVPRPAPYITMHDTIICETSPLILTAGDSIYNTEHIYWYQAGTDHAVNAESASYQVKTAGKYYLSQSNGKCTGLSEIISVIIDRQPVVKIEPRKIWIATGSIAILNGINKITDKVSYQWSSATYPQTLLQEAGFEQNNPLILVSPALATTIFHLTVKSEHQACEIKDSAIVNIEIPVKPWNSLSPNGDGTYDTWIIDNIDEYPNALIQVFNRWGNLVYESKGYSKQWNGTNYRSGEALPVATYYYLIYPNGATVKESFTGDVTIVK